MGTWAVDAFGNDDACDWAAGLLETTDFSMIETTLSRVIDVGTAYLEAPDAAESLAAAEVIARLQGRFGERNAYTEAVDIWVIKINLPANALAQKAHTVIDRIMSDQSELFELWQDSDDFEAWKAGVADLKRRILVN